MSTQVLSILKFVDLIYLNNALFMYDFRAGTVRPCFQLFL